MDNKAQIHQNIMAFLDNYLQQTPKDVIKEQIQKISEMNFEGVSARDYFLNFDKYYLGLKVPSKQCKPQWEIFFNRPLVIYQFDNQINREFCNEKIGVDIEKLATTLS